MDTNWLDDLLSFSLPINFVRWFNIRNLIRIKFNKKVPEYL